MSLPSIDVIVPTFNCGPALRRALTELRRQTQPGLRTIVVDGGSSDDTCQVADEFGAEVHVNPGQYSIGVEGARHFGEKLGHSEYIWYLDSDNVLSAPTVASDLVRALEERPVVSFAVPPVEIDPSAHPFNNWISLLDQAYLSEAFARGERSAGYVQVDDLTYGVPNAPLFRRSVIEAAGGYDSDVHLLARLRRLGLAHAALSTGRGFYHYQISSVGEFRRRWVRRIARYASTDPSRFFVESDGPGARTPSARGGVPGGPVDIALRFPARSLAELFRTADPTWLWGLAYPLIVAAIIVASPAGSFRAMRAMSTA